MAELIGIKLKRLPADDLIEWEARGSASQKEVHNGIARWAGSARPTQWIGSRGSDMEAKDETNKASSRPNTG